MSLIGILSAVGAVTGLVKKFTGSNLGSAYVGDRLNRKSMQRQYENQLALQDDAQAFNAEQAEINRNFNARQAEIARDWQESFYNKYQSPSALMAQYKSAGINPMLVAGQGSGSPPSSSSASGSVAGSGIGSAAAGNLVSDMVQLLTLKKEMRLLDAQTAEVNSRANLNNTQSAFNVEQTNKARIDVQFSPLIYQLNLKSGLVEISNMQAGIQQTLANTSLLNKRVDEINQNIAESNQRIKESDQRIKESKSVVTLNEARRFLTVAQEVLTQQQTDTQKSLMWKYDSDKEVNSTIKSLNNANAGYINSRKLSEDVERAYLEKYGAKPPTVLLDPQNIGYLLGGKFVYKNGKW